MCFFVTKTVFQKCVCFDAPPLKHRQNIHDKPAQSPLGLLWKLLGTWTATIKPALRLCGPRFPGLQNQEPRSCRSSSSSKSYTGYPPSSAMSQGNLGFLFFPMEQNSPDSMKLPRLPFTCTWVTWEVFRVQDN